MVKYTSHNQTLSWEQNKLYVVLGVLVFCCFFLGGGCTSQEKKWSKLCNVSFCVCVSFFAIKHFVLQKVSICVQYFEMWKWCMWNKAKIRLSRKYEYTVRFIIWRTVHRQNQNKILNSLTITLCTISDQILLTHSTRNNTT